jgi:hypothetical protein
MITNDPPLNSNTGVLQHWQVIFPVMPFDDGADIIEKVSAIGAVETVTVAVIRSASIAVTV